MTPVRTHRVVLSCALVVSLLIHTAVLLPALVAAATADGGMTDLEHELHDETPEDEPQEVLGLDDSDVSTMTWVGYDTYQEHLAELADFDQAEFVNASSPTQSTNPGQQPAPQPGQPAQQGGQPSTAPSQTPPTGGAPRSTGWANAVAGSPPPAKGRWPRQSPEPPQNHRRTRSRPKTPSRPKVRRSPIPPLPTRPQATEAGQAPTSGGGGSPADPSDEPPPNRMRRRRNRMPPRPSACHARTGSPGDPRVAGSGTGRRRNRC